MQGIILGEGRGERVERGDGPALQNAQSRRTIGRRPGAQAPLDVLGAAEVLFDSFAKFSQVLNQSVIKNLTGGLFPCDRHFFSSAAQDGQDSQLFLGDGFALNLA